MLSETLGIVTDYEPPSAISPKRSELYSNRAVVQAARWVSLTAASPAHRQPQPQHPSTQAPTHSAKAHLAYACICPQARPASHSAVRKA
ncbi:uncharacterized protein M421DRAFT_185465 [Didymella exigua CBS 183.55]|uniref:Uncharacterized protein n=1 Tax=Didymella exigua CBS 183.55 TaxID=1150837 RepID=A0A6A5RFZ3_9PLEO|nr:uncharacterized protein M421DRAFT_185465 [Didymella exigua CBS 183.55]KAF1927231.1 hypothetical protein M421DRAFT_185465 [Didymella exigua CBS 183.55]